MHACTPDPTDAVMAPGQPLCTARGDDGTVVICKQMEILPRRLALIRKTSKTRPKREMKVSYLDTSRSRKGRGGGGGEAGGGGRWVAEKKTKKTKKKKEKKRPRISMTIVIDEDRLTAVHFYTSPW